MKTYLKVFKALSDGSRLRIYKMLEAEDLCVCEITEVLGLAVSTVSAHLKVLKEAGLVEEYKDGKWVNYRISKMQDTFGSRLQQLLIILQDEVFSADLKTAAGSDRNIICNISGK